MMGRCDVTWRPHGRHKIIVSHLSGLWTIEIQPAHSQFGVSLFGDWPSARAFADELSRKRGWLVADQTPTHLRVDQAGQRNEA